MNQKQYLFNCHDDMNQTKVLLKTFKSREAKEAIRKLRYLLILTTHYLKYGEDTPNE